MISGYHTTALTEHDLATAGALLRQLGFGTMAVRLSLSRLDPLADGDVLRQQLTILATGLRDLRLVVDADGPYLIDPWDPQVPALMDQEDEAGRRRLDYLLSTIDMVEQLGGGLVTFAVGRQPAEMETERALDALTEALLELGDRAESQGVLLGVRPRQGHFVDSVGRFERLVRWAGESPVVQLAADVGSMVTGGEMPVVDLLGRVGDRLAGVYLSEARLVGGEPLIGSGSVSATRVVAGLRAERFAGPVIVEPAVASGPEEAGRFYKAVFG